MNYVTFRKTLLEDVTSFIARLDAVYEDQDMHINNKIKTFKDIGDQFGIAMEEIIL